MEINNSSAYFQQNDKCFTNNWLLTGWKKNVKTIKLTKCLDYLCVLYISLYPNFCFIIFSIGKGITGLKLTSYSVNFSFDLIVDV